MSRFKFPPLLLSPLVLIGLVYSHLSHAIDSEQVNWPDVNTKLKQAPAVEKQIDELIEGMTIEQKVAQMVQPEIGYLSVEQMRKYGFGSYLNGGNTAPYGNKRASMKQWLQYADEMYQASVDASIDGSAIPTVWGTDAMHGHSNVYGATLFPHNIGLDTILLNLRSFRRFFNCLLNFCCDRDGNRNWSNDLPLLYFVKMYPLISFNGTDTFPCVLL